MVEDLDRPGLVIDIMTLGTWWQWKYLSCLRCLTLTLHNVPTGCCGQYALVVVDGRMQCVPAQDCRSAALCLVNEPIDVGPPLLDSSPICLSSEPKIDVRGDTLSLTWHGVGKGAVAGGESRPAPDASSVRCKRCRCQLSAPGSRFKRLPSEHWSELLDCWSCHRQEFAGIVSHLPTSNQFVPHDQLVVFYSAFHFSMLFNAQTMRCVGACVCCKECGFTVGSRGEHHLVSIPATRTADSLGVQCFVARRMIELMLAHSSFSFKINDSLVLKLVNWTTMLSARNSNTLQAIVVVEAADRLDDACEHIDLLADELQELRGALADQRLHDCNSNSYLINA